MHDIVQLISNKRLLIVPVFLGLVGCAGASGTPEHRAEVDPLFLVDTLDGGPSDATGAEPISARGAGAFGIETQMVRADGAVLQAPALTVYARQRANVSISDQVAYIETFEVEVSEGDFVADPIVGVLQHGVVLEVCAASEGDDALLAYRAHVSDLTRPIPERHLSISAGAPVTIQLPKATSSEAAGVRRVVPGVWTHLASLDAGSGAVDLRVRVVPVSVVLPDFEDRASEVFLSAPEPEMRHFTSEGGEDVDLAGWLHTGGDDLRVLVDALVLPGAAPLGEVLDVSLARRYGLDSAAPMREMALTSRPVQGATMRVSLDEAYVADFDQEWDAPVVRPRVRTLRSGIEATFLAGDRMEVRWTTAPTWQVFSTQLAYGPPVTVDLPEVRSHALTMTLDPGAWLLPLARTATGGTLAMRVTVGVLQRRVASHPQATRKRRPPASTAR